MIPFDTVSPGIRSPEHRNKTAEEMKARLNALPGECCTPFVRDLPLQMREVLAVVVRANKAAGGPCIVHRADIADAIGVTPDVAQLILGRLVEIGAVECLRRVGQAPQLRAVTDVPRSGAPISARKAADPRPVMPEPIRRAAGITDAKLKAGLVGLRSHEAPTKRNLLSGVVGASR